MLGLPTVKISAKSVRSIEQPSTGTGRGLGAMAPKFFDLFISIKTQSTKGQYFDP
jgi:hypothetical protein